MHLANWIEVGRMDDYSRQDTPVHRIDARAKVIATMAFIVAIMSFPRCEISALVPFLLYPLVLVRLGRIPFGYILKKIIVAAPFAIAIGIFNPFFERETAVIIGPVAISGGWLSFASIMIRFALTVGAALALVACTGMYPLCAGLERIGLPRVFVAQLLFLYRYLFVIADEGSRMKRSLELRSAGLAPVPLRVYGSLVGHLLLRSLARSEKIYQAMIARGFDGEIKVIRKTAFRPADWAFLLGWAAFFVTARAWNISDWLGRVLAGSSP
jgi:cobalt/nickel transport system permease protein